MPYKDKEEGREYHRLYQLQYYPKHSEKYKRYASAWRRSPKGKLYQGKYWIDRKSEVLAHYGNGHIACVRCGFDNIRALSIDHIGGGGNTHRKITGEGCQFYYWLKRNNFPTGYQTLCMNCQALKKYENKEYGNYFREGNEV